MSYVPPHKRHSNDAIRPSPVPESVLPKFRTAHENTNEKNRKIAYAEDCISRWLAVWSNGTEGNSTQSVRFDPVSIESAEWRATEKPLVLVHNNARKENNEVGATEVRTPWVSIAEKVDDDLLLAFKRAKNGVEHGVPEVVKLRLVARFGKFLFDGRPAMCMEGLKDELVAESKVIKAKKWLHTNLPSSYIEKVKYGAESKIGFKIEETKDIYYLVLTDKNGLDSSIFCKCTVKEDKKLNMYKVAGSALRHLIIDLSCIDRDLDLRLMVDSKKIVTAPSEDEVKSMKELVDAAVIDPNVKGGLRWPLGKASSGDRYSVCGIWHTITTSYINSDSTLRLKVREADRFDFVTGTGGAAHEVFLILKGISANLQEEKAEKGFIMDKLKDVLRTIWKNFLTCDPFLA